MWDLNLSPCKFFSFQSPFIKHRQEKMRKKPVVGRKGMGENKGYIRVAIRVPK